MILEKIIQYFFKFYHHSADINFYKIMLQEPPYWTILPIVQWYNDMMIDSFNLTFTTDQPLSPDKMSAIHDGTGNEYLYEL